MAGCDDVDHSLRCLTGHEHRKGTLKDLNPVDTLYGDITKIHDSGERLIGSRSVDQHDYFLRLTSSAGQELFIEQKSAVEYLGSFNPGHELAECACPYCRDVLPEKNRELSGELLRVERLCEGERDSFSVGQPCPCRGNRLETVGRSETVGPGGRHEERIRG